MPKTTRKRKPTIQPELVQERLDAIYGIGHKVTADQAHPIMEEMIQTDDRYDMHVLLITHGRQICKARIPQCGRCPLNQECPASSQKNKKFKN